MDTAAIPDAPLSAFFPADGELEVVEVLNAEGSLKRLCELGICPGKRIRVLRRGDPAIVAVGESRFALAHELLACVFVRQAV